MKKAIKYFIFLLVVLISIFSFLNISKSASYNFNIVNANNKNILSENTEQKNIENNKESVKKETENNNTSNKLASGSDLINNLKFVVNGKSNNNLNNIDLFNYVIERIKVSYVEDVNEKEIYENALKGLISSLDPHSVYMNEKEFKEMQVQIKGEFGGLGIVVTKDINFIKVISPIDDTPASKAGILAGDYISEIDGASTFDMSLTDAVEKMRGKVGEKVKIVVLRKGENKPLDFNIRREIIKNNVVKGSIKNDNIIYLRISNFIETTQEDLIKKFNLLKNKLSDGILKGVILDLRNNPGGLLDQSIKVSELFLDGNKTVVSIKGKENKFLEDYKTTNKEALIKNVPVVVLVNEGSASASEIVAGALQDHKVAIVMGEKTFGKASVQQVFPLMNGGAMKITIARYYTPSGKSIQLDGIVPDIAVKKGEVLFSSLKYPEIREENLKGHLKKQDDKKDIVKETIEKKIKEKNNKENKNSENSENDINEDDIKDYQLLKAIDLINGVNFYNKK